MRQKAEALKLDVCVYRVWIKLQQNIYSFLVFLKALRVIISLHAQDRRYTRKTKIVCLAVKIITVKMVYRAHVCARNGCYNYRHLSIVPDRT